MRPRTALALGLAGLATAGLGTAVLPAGAEPRSFQLTLADGDVVTLTVDVPPGTSLDRIVFPGVAAEQIRGIVELPQPGAGQTQAETTGDGQSTAATTAPTPPTTTPADPAQPQVEAEAEAAEPEPADGGGRQRTTGRDKRRSQAERQAIEQALARRGGAALTDAGSAAAAAPGEGGMPVIANPTTSIAEPGAAPIGVPNFFISKFQIPPFLLPIYQAAGIEYGIRWEVLAAINEIETDYGRNLNVSSAGALGWMQFMPATWKQYGVDANGDRRKDPYNPVDAIFAAARYLRAAGAEDDLRRAIFAYNHADWYVDSVLMRARLIGGLPSNLVGSLTGLTQGMFPVRAKARYADELQAREARRRIARGRNAALPVEGDGSRRGISIYTRPGSPAVAVQDGKVVGLGSTRRLGRYVKLRDAYGNTYTYAHLKKISARHPVPKETRRPPAPAAEPPRDPEPLRAASAGRQPRERAAERAARRTRVQAVRKERLFATPRRPASFKAGGREQVGATATKSDLELLGLPRDQVVMRRLRVGSRVVGGTVLGRIGRTSMRRAPHLLFEIRPAGRGAPRIDPKPILDGWKLLESTAIYRAKGKNPFFGRDARTPSIGQILLMPKADLERRVLRNPRIDVYGCGRRDIRGSRIDRRVLATLEYLAASGLRPTVTSLDCGHSTYTASGNVSHHASGNAVDIAKINGVPVRGHQGRGSVTDLAVRRLLTLQGTMRPAQIISLMRYEDASNTVAMADHDDHIHVGFTPYFDTNSRTGRQLAAVLKPGQWIKLVDRLGAIDNPTVRLKPSKASLAVRPGRASRRHRGE